MSAVYARARSKEAPMVGIEFTNRSKTIPAWRVDMQDKENMDNNNNASLKRSHDTAIPPPAPFDPKKGVQDIPQPVFGENLRYLFRPPHLTQPSNPWAGPSSMEIPEVDMKDVELSPPRPPPHSSFGQAGESSRVRMEEMNEGAENAEARQGNESPERRLISNAAVRRIARKRKDGRARSRSNRIRKGSRATDADEEDDSVDEEDEDGSPRKGRALTRNTSNHYTLNLPGPPPVKTDTPYILLGYLQFMFNLSLILVFLYLLVQFIFTVQHDVEQRIGEYSMDILQEITTCAQLYKQNLCDTSPIPAMLHQCATWETCMNRDPKVVGRARVGAEMLAEVVNGFVEPISWKTLLFTLLSLAFMTIFVNGLVMLYRARLHPDRQHQHQQQPQQHHQPSPHAALPFPNFAPYQTPYGGYLQPGQASQQQHGISWHPESDVEGIPRQRRRLENGESPTLGTS
ncbi:uncharacterized protein FOMMEDRAFT_19705 [Fomitiporia mediterranea MF3/22]|uniref:uncharacterized protein n=1 Tax=Fomitiporia mediterranea (strain MF3/22) TaxID=694068 RepID=UPI0004408EA7|nr:uncharacterized protein FOMMEDRAFT_19705 [Fomitiporia mediterranea MF3/22]EJD04486.1 hypothetical protein FOMMEDRAFT_19705 [Fomitiporia mediterranea MF3/22]